MSNPRKSNVARLSNRRYETPKPKDRPEYPASLSEDARPVFAELVEAMPDGAAAKSDSLFLEMASNVLLEYRRDPESFATPRLNALRLMFVELGLTPASRRRLELAPNADENPFAAIARLRGDRSVQILEKAVDRI